MSNIIVVGAGWMGQAIAYGLHQLQNTVTLYEPTESQCEIAKNKLKSLNVNFEIKNKVIDYHDLCASHTSALISAAPYSENENIAQLCCRLKIPYCDLGGNPKISSKIQKRATCQQSTVFTDLGLAPGYANILAQNLVQDSPYEVSDVSIKVGGLPKQYNNEMKYNMVFSPKGLVNEYTGKCKYLRFGEVEKAEALSGVEEINNIIPNEEMECFFTKGGLSSTLQDMIDLGVKHCHYKTLRFKGHAYLLKFLMQTCQLQDEELCKVLTKCCPPTQQDIVIIAVDIDGRRYSTIINYDEHWTAMQKSTGFPAAAICHLMAKTKIKGGYVLGYKNVPLNTMWDCLNQIDPMTQWKLS